MVDKKQYTLTYSAALKKALQAAVQDGGAIGILTAPFAARKTLRESIALHAHDVAAERAARLRTIPKQTAPAPVADKDPKRDIPARQLEKLAMERSARDL
ncbi:MAG: hypothetical protein PHX68_03580 [Alphaproteobacteria bacterium]|nr:hypothetical protein [Alphaproteobacteria bacterium]